MNYTLGWITALLVVCLQGTVTGQSDSDDVVSVTPAPNEVAMNVELQTSNEYFNLPLLLSEPGESGVPGMIPELTGSADYYSGSSYCYIGYNAIPHGSLGSVSTLNPCWKMLCWYGRLYDREDGCYFQGQCYGINSEFEVNCVTRSCRKTARSDNTYRYSIEYVRQGCQDAQRRCRRVGETNFSAYVRGYYFSNCVCRSEGYTICHGSG